MVEGPFPAGGGVSSHVFHGHPSQHLQKKLAAMQEKEKERLEKIRAREEKKK